MLTHVSRNTAASAHLRWESLWRWVGEGEEELRPGRALHLRSHLRCLPASSAVETVPCLAQQGQHPAQVKEGIRVKLRLQDVNDP